MGKRKKQLSSIFIGPDCFDIPESVGSVGVLMWTYKEQTKSWTERGLLRTNPPDKALLCCNYRWPLTTDCRNWQVQIPPPRTTKQRSCSWGDGNLFSLLREISRQSRPIPPTLASPALHNKHRYPPSPWAHPTQSQLSCLCVCPFFILPPSQSGFPD